MREFNSMKALSSGIRQEIIMFLKTGDKYLSEIAEKVSKTPQTIDFHLNILRNNSFVEIVERNGKKYYHLKDKDILNSFGPRGFGVGRNRHQTPHEIVSNSMEEINKKLKSIEDKLDRLLKQ